MSKDDGLDQQIVDFVTRKRRKDAQGFLAELAGKEAITVLTVDADASKTAVQLALEALDRMPTVSSFQVSDVTSVAVKRQTAPVSSDVLVERFDVTMGLNEQYIYLVAHGDARMAERTVVFQVDGGFYATVQPHVILPNTLPDDVGSLFPYAARVNQTRYIFSPSVAPLTPPDSPRRAIR